MFLTMITLFYTLFYFYFINQRETMADIIVQDVEQELAELSYMLSAQLRGSKDLKRLKPYLDRKVSHSHFIKNVFLTDDVRVLLSTDYRVKALPPKEKISQKHKEHSLKSLYEAMIFQDDVRFYIQDKLYSYNLFLSLNLKKIDEFFSQRENNFLILFGILPIMLFAFQWVFLRIFLQKPLEALNDYAKDPGKKMPSFRLKELKLIRDSLRRTFKKLNKERLKTKEQEELLVIQSRNAAMGEMIAMIAHQWRQPLMSISTIASTIKVELALDKLDPKNLEIKSDNILKQTTHLTQTINDFSDFFKAENGEVLVSIADSFDASLEIIKDLLHNHEIKVTKHCLSDRKLTIPNRELQQVFINILKNAHDALIEKVESDREIIITIKEDGDMLVILLEDNAGGISPEVLSKIFDPYFSTKHEKNGTGLGLYMSKRIIESHMKGTLTCSNGKQGAIFKIMLPFNKK